MIIHGIVTYNIISKLSKTKNFISGKHHLFHNMFINGICEGVNLINLLNKNVINKK